MDDAISRAPRTGAHRRGHAGTVTGQFQRRRPGILAAAGSGRLRRPSGEWPESLDRLIVERAISDITCSAIAGRCTELPSASPRDAHCESMWSRRAICDPIGSPSRKAGSTVIPSCRGTGPGIASARRRSGLARPATGAGELPSQGGRGRAVHNGLDRRNVAVPALRDRTGPDYQLIEYAGLAAPPGADAPRRVAGGGGDRGVCSRPGLLFLSRCSSCDYQSAGALAVPRDASGDRARPHLLRPSRPLGGAARSLSSSARQRIGRLDRYHRLPRGRARDCRAARDPRRRRFGRALGAQAGCRHASTARSALWRLPADCR